MNTIENILMQRDGLTKEDAVNYINNTRSEIYNAIECGDFDLAEDIFTSDLGLEMDYIFDLI